MTTKEHLDKLMTVCVRDSWLHVFLKRAKLNLSEITAIKKYNSDEDKWVLDTKSKINLEQLIDEIINNLDSMHDMLVYNKAEDKSEFNGKHWFWEQRGDMSSLLMKLKAQS